MQQKLIGAGVGAGVNKWLQQSGSLLGVRAWGWVCKARTSRGGQRWDQTSRPPAKMEINIEPKLMLCGVPLHETLRCTEVQLHLQLALVCRPSTTQENGG